MRSLREEPAFWYHFLSSVVPDPDEEEEACAVEDPTGFAGWITSAALAWVFDGVVDLMELARSGTEGGAAVFSLGRDGSGLFRLGAELEDELLLVAALISKRDPSRSYRSANRG